MICPDCFKNFQKEISLRSLKNEYVCDNCKKNYPFKKIIYVLREKCNPQECHYECMKNCPQMALTKVPVGDRAYFTLFGLIKKIKTPKISITAKCNNCGQCIIHCPFGALVAINTPSFLLVDSSFIDHPFQDISNTPLRAPLPEKEIRPIIPLLYKDIIQEIEKQKPKIIVDNGCGANLLKMFIPEGKILSFDVSVNHNSFYPVDGIINGEQLPFKKESIDLFVSTNVLEHVTNPENYLLEMKRTLKEDGRIIITVPAPWWHASKLLSPHPQLSYLLHILKNPLVFLKNPIKDLDLFWAHEKDCNHEGAKQTMTMSKEIKSFSAKNWEKSFDNHSLIIEKKINIGNILSNNILMTKFAKKMSNSSSRPIHFIYTLKKTWKIIA